MRLTESRLKLIIASGAFIATLLAGMLGMAYIEHWSLFDALWVTVVTLTTTGYGDLIPQTMTGKIFMMMLLITGVGVVAFALGAVTNILIERQILEMMDQTKLKKAISGLSNHIIVCGAGRVGSHVAHVLKEEKASYVMVDSNSDIVAAKIEEGELIIEGDATNDEVLMSLGLDRAIGIVCALPEDARNLYVTLSARDVNPNLKIVARAERHETMDKLRRAGADKVIAPTLIAGRQMAMAMIKPLTVDLIDTLYTPHKKEYVLEEYLITEQSPLAGKEVRVIFQSVENVTVIAIIRNDEIIANVRGSHCLEIGDNLILLGARRNLEQFESSLNCVNQ